MIGASARLLLDLGRVEQGGDDRRRSDADRDAGLHQLGRGALRSPVVRRFCRSSADLYGAAAPLWKPHERRASRPLPELQGAQALAADPQVHAALSASAGTGKTQVLTARVLRLLLRARAPESILCLTFTKAAAAEMANRIGARLAAWVRIPRQRPEEGAVRARRGQRSADRASARGNCSPGCSTAPAASRSRPSTASPKACSRHFPPRPGSRPASSRSRGGPSRSWCGGPWPT